VPMPARRFAAILRRYRALSRLTSSRLEVAKCRNRLAKASRSVLS
jgi:hypothetical protein